MLEATLSALAAELGATPLVPVIVIAYAALDGLHLLQRESDRKLLIVMQQHRVCDPDAHAHCRMAFLWNRIDAECRTVLRVVMLALCLRALVALFSFRVHAGLVILLALSAYGTAIAYRHATTPSSAPHVTLRHYACQAHNFYVFNRARGGSDAWFDAIEKRRFNTNKAHGMLPSHLSPEDGALERHLACRAWKLAPTVVDRIMQVAGGLFPHSVFISDLMARVDASDSPDQVAKRRAELVDLLQVADRR